MANGLWNVSQINTLGAYSTRDMFYALDSEYNKVYFRYQDQVLFQMLDLDTNVITTLPASPSMGGYENACCMCQSVINGRVYFYNNFDPNFYKDAIYTITDRNTGAGSWDQPAITQMPEYGSGGERTYHAYYRQAQNMIYFPRKNGNNLSFMTSTVVTAGSPVYTTNAVNTGFNVGGNLTQTGTLVIDRFVCGIATPSTQLYVWDFNSNTGGLLSDYVLVATGSSLNMTNVHLFASGNTVNFFHKDYKYTYDFNALQWSRTAITLGYGSNSTQINASMPVNKGSVYIMGGTLAGQDTALKKYSYYPPAPSGVSASLVNGKVRLSWIDNTDEETFYIIERKSSVETTFTQVSENFTLTSTPPSAVGTTITWTDETADVSNYNYTYKVKARYLQI